MLPRQRANGGARSNLLGRPSVDYIFSKRRSDRLIGNRVTTNPRVTIPGIEDREPPVFDMDTTLRDLGDG